MSIRRQHSSRFKAQVALRVALEAIRNQRTIAEIASECGVHPSQVNRWKKHVLDELPSIFSNSHGRGQRDNEKFQAELYPCVREGQIGQLKVDLDCLCFGYRVARS